MGRGGRTFGSHHQTIKCQIKGIGVHSVKSSFILGLHCESQQNHLTKRVAAVIFLMRCHDIAEATKLLILFKSDNEICRRYNFGSKKDILDMKMIFIPKNVILGVKIRM